MKKKNSDMNNKISELSEQLKNISKENMVLHNQIKEVNSQLDTTKVVEVDDIILSLEDANHDILEKLSSAVQKNMKKTSVKRRKKKITKKKQKRKRKLVTETNIYI